MSDTALIVPIRLAGLCVGQDDEHAAPEEYGTRDFADVALRFHDMPYAENGNAYNPGPNLASSVLPKPFGTSDHPPGKGVHLHWALPESLRRGATMPDNNGVTRVTFPDVPNRWLVVRAADAGDPVAWVVESDHVWDKEADGGSDPLKDHNDRSRAIPIEPLMQKGSTKSFQTLGRAFRLTDWRGDAGRSYADRHTALGYGSLSFAAAYPHCGNVFGFYDPLDDVPSAASLTYVAIGWYAGQREDPAAKYLQGLEGKDGNTRSYADEVKALAEHFGWSFDWTAGLAVPSRTVCSGLISGVKWDPTTRYVHELDGKGIDVVIGNTTAEAVAALLAHRHPEHPDLELLLDLFQLDVLGNLHDPNGAAAADEVRHEAGFGPSAAGTVWVIRPNTPGNVDPDAIVHVSDTDVLGAADRAAHLQDAKPELMLQLNALNLAQERCDYLDDEIRSRREQIFIDWCKCMRLQYVDDDRTQSKLTDLRVARSVVNKQIDALTNTLADLNTSLKTVAFGKAALEKELGAGFVVAATPAARYWQPLDPVVLITGPDAQPSVHYASDDGTDSHGKLVCRRSDQVITALTIEGPPAAAVASAALPMPAGAGALPADVQALLAENLFLAPGRASALAHAVNRAYGGQLPTGQTPASVAERIAAAQQAALARTASALGIALSGVAPPPLAVSAWQQPWIPFQLEWEVEFSPVQPARNVQSADYDPRFIAEYFRLDDDEIDLALTTAMPNENFRSYRGAMVLAGRTEIKLATQIARYVEQASNLSEAEAGELKALGNDLDFAALAQALTGFNQLLLMRAQTLQLPINDPLAYVAKGGGGPSLAKFTEGVRKAVEGDGSPRTTSNPVRAMPAPLLAYHPVRAGTARLARLRVVDAFGQLREIPTKDLVVAASLKPKRKEDAGGGAILLPPRVAQPCRLMFRWLSAGKDATVQTNSHPASSPICGWALFNHLDTSLMVYDAAGAPLGALSMTGRPWQGAPGSEKFDDPDRILDDADPTLRRFVESIRDHPTGTAFLEDLLDVIDRQMTSINPLGVKQDEALSLLIGQPLALVRARLRLELQGLPALDESWPAFLDTAAKLDAAKTDEQARSALGQRPCANFTAIRVPIRLGDLGKLNDGLVGYFVDEGGQDDYRRFYAGAADGGKSDAVVSPDLARTALAPVAASDASVGITVAMLIDPRGEVHATTGVLPVKGIGIPPDLYADALARIAVTFATTPVLAADPDMALPLPDTPGFAWSWMTRNAGGTGWSNQAEIPALNPKSLPAAHQRIEEGWLRLTRDARRR
jgi:hypothetical protein